jgi:O-antigen/teichoic acid export membrane protein
MAGSRPLLMMLESTHRLRARSRRLFGAGRGLRSQLLRASAGSLSLKATYVALNLLTSLILARHLGPAGFGVYAFALAVVALLGIPSQLGVPSLFVRLGAVYRAEQNYGLLRGLFRSGAWLVTCATTLAALLAAGAVVYLRPASAEVPAGTLILALWLLPVVGMLAAYGSAVRGLGNVVLGLVPENLLRPAFVLCGLFAVTHVANLTARSALIANAGATSLALLISWLLLRRIAPPEMRAAKAVTRTLDWTRAAVPFMLLAGVQVINYQTDILMLGLISGQTEVGLYRVAVQVSDGMGMILIAVTSVITPHLARLHAFGDWAAIQKILVYSHRAGVIVLLPIALAVIVFGERLLAVAFGAEFAGAADPLTILALGKVAFALVGFSGVALSMFGQAGLASVLSAAMAAGNIGLNALLIPIMGMEGAAYATVISAVSMNVLLAIWIRKKFGINPTAIARL